MIWVTFGTIRSPYAERHAADTKLVAFALVLAVLWCSGTAAVREIVKELPVLRHETRFGVRLLPYLLSKVAVLGALAVLQSLLLLAVVRYGTRLTGSMAVQAVVLALTAVTGVSLGLLVSAAARTSERAMTVLPVLLIGQAIFSGGLARLTGWVKAAAMAGVPAFWSLDGLKGQFSSALQTAVYPGPPGSANPAILGEGHSLAVAVAALTGQAVLLLAGTYATLRWLVRRGGA